MRDIYCVDYDLDNLLLVEGLYVINGAWEIQRRKGRLFIPNTHRDIEVVYVMNAPCKGDYNTVLEKAKKLIAQGAGSQVRKLARGAGRGKRSVEGDLQHGDRGDRREDVLGVKTGVGDGQAILRPDGGREVLRDPASRAALNDPGHQGPTEEEGAGEIPTIPPDPHRIAQVTAKDVQVAYARKLMTFIKKAESQDRRGIEDGDEYSQFPEECHLNHLRGMCQRMIDNQASMSDTKCGRWIGYIQGVLICRGYSTVDRERQEYKKCKAKLISARTAAAKSPSPAGCPSTQSGRST